LAFAVLRRRAVTQRKDPEVNSQTRIADHVNALTERIVRDLQRHIDNPQDPSGLTTDERIRAERAVARQLLTGRRDLFRSTRPTGHGLVDIGEECINAAVAASESRVGELRD
jgi:hypothetical protein